MTRRAGHHAKLAEGLGGNHGGELDHQPGPGIQIAMTEHFVEYKVVENLDELGVAHRQGGDVAGKKSVVVLARALIRRLCRSPCRSPAVRQSIPSSMSRTRA